MDAPSEHSGGTFRALRHPDFRLLLAGQALGSAGLQMDQVARGWLVYEMTGSPLLLGLVQAARALPFLLFGLLAGVVADRYDRKRQIILSQNANAILNVILAGLVLTGNVQPWHIVVTAFLSGAAIAFQFPARQAMIPAVVPREDVMNAVALNSGVNNSMRTIAPAFAGVLVALVGVGWTYVVQAGLYVVASLWTERVSALALTRTAGSLKRESFRASVWGGFTYVRANPTVFGLLLLAFVPILLAQPYQALAPVFARDIFRTGATGQGVLLAVAGIGSVCGAVMVARMVGERQARVQLIGGVVVFGLGLVAFALSPWYAVALVALFVVGFASTSYQTLNQTFLQRYTDEAYLGRVMSIYLLQNGLAPAGSLLVGALATGIGAPYALAIMGMLTAAFAIAVFIRVAPIRALGRAATPVRSPRPLDPLAMELPDTSV